MQKMIEIHNEMTCFMQLWRLLASTRQECKRNHKRFTIRRVMMMWFGDDVPVEHIREVCRRLHNFGIDLYGMDALPTPVATSLELRVLICAIVSVRLDIPITRVNMFEVDQAHDWAFPRSTPLLTYDGEQLYPPRYTRRGNCTEYQILKARKLYGALSLLS